MPINATCTKCDREFNDLITIQALTVRFVPYCEFCGGEVKYRERTDKEVHNVEDNYIHPNRLG